MMERQGQQPLNEFQFRLAYEAEKNRKKTAWKSKQKKEKKPLTDILIEIALKNAQMVFLDEREVPYVKIQDKYFPLRSKDFKGWLCKLFYQEYKKGVYREALNAALNTLEGYAQFEGEGTFPLHNRVAWHNGEIFYDLSNEEWQAVRISQKGWQIVKKPVLFRRFLHQEPQVLPLPGGNVWKLLEFLNFGEDDKILYLIWVISCFVPDIPHPVVILYGEQGGAKTVAFKLTRLLIDPSKTLVLSMPKDFNELIQKLDHNYCSFFDNLAGLQNWQSDALCRACTGEGFSKRKLFTDDGDVIYSYKRCVGLNGINCVAVAPDLLDRSILFRVERIPENKREEEKKIFENFKKEIPLILGGCFDVLTAALKIYSEINLQKLPRMADFAMWGYAIAEALGIEGDRFLEIYNKNIRRQHEEAIEGNPIALAVKYFAQEHKKWQGTASELLEEISPVAEHLKLDVRAKYWPKDPSSLVRKLNVVKVNLLELGIKCKTGVHSRQGNLIFLEFLEKAVKKPSQPSHLHKPRENEDFQREGWCEGKFIPSQIPSQIPSHEKASNDEHFGNGEGCEGNFPYLSKKEKDNEDILLEDGEVIE